MFKKQYLILIIFVFVTLVGIVIRYLGSANSWLWEFWGVVDVSFAVSMGILAFMGYRDYIKSEDEIKIFFRVDKELKNTGLSLLRKDCTRGEILGILGMMQRKTNRRFLFDSRELPLLLREVQRVQKSDKNIFEIEVTREEFEQFDLGDIDENPTHL